MNKRGQALIEFVLILPIVIIILFVIVDFGIIFSHKASLENNSYDIIELIKNGENIENIENKYVGKSITVSTDGDYMVVNISENVKIFGFGLKNILPNPYPISLERYLPNE